MPDSDGSKGASGGPTEAASSSQQQQQQQPTASTSASGSNGGGSSSKRSHHSSNNDNLSKAMVKYGELVILGYNGQLPLGESSLLFGSDAIINVTLNWFFALSVCIAIATISHEWINSIPHGNQIPIGIW